jgi:hypothetical protein
MLYGGEGPSSRTFRIFNPDPQPTNLVWNLKSERSYYQGLLLYTTHFLVCKSNLLLNYIIFKKRLELRSGNIRTWVKSRDFDLKTPIQVLGNVGLSSAREYALVSGLRDVASKRCCCGRVWWFCGRAEEEEQ